MMEQGIQKIRKKKSTLPGGRTNTHRKRVEGGVELGKTKGAVKKTNRIRGL